MKAKVIYAACSLVFLSLAAGCQTGSGYVPEGDTHFVAANRLTATEKLMLADRLCSALYIDPTFSESYKEKTRGLAKGKTRPVIAVLPFENNTRNGQNDSEATRQLVLEIASRLRKSGRFTVLNDTWTAEAIGRMVGGNARLGENGNALQNVGDFEPPDYVLSGDLFVEQDGNIYTHSLNAHITDMANRQVFWSETVRLGKSDGKPVR